MEAKTVRSECCVSELGRTRLQRSRICDLSVRVLGESMYDSVGYLAMVFLVLHLSLRNEKGIPKAMA